MNTPTIVYNEFVRDQNNVFYMMYLFTHDSFGYVETCVVEVKLQK